MLRLVLRLAAAVLVVAAVGVVVPAPAGAATCRSASGVSVIVDFHQLGGGVQTFCDQAGAGHYADEQFQDAGHQLTYVQNEAFVCQVDRAPDAQCARTPPGDAYWSLWWSDGRSGTWKYASVGVTSLRVAEGGYVALSWQGQWSQAKPRATPATHGTSSASPSPTTRPPSSPHPSSPGQAPPPSSTPAPSGSSSTVIQPPSSGPASPTGHSRHSRLTGSPRAKGSKQDHDSTQAGEPVAGVRPGATSGNGASGSDGLPGWVAPVAIAVLFIGAGTIALVRRKSTGGA